MFYPNNKFVWEDPTENTDGSALTEEEIDGYYIHLGHRSGEYIIKHYVPNGEPDEAYLGSISDLVSGHWFVAMSTLNKMKDYDAESDLSNEMEFDYSDSYPIPNPPVNFSIAS